MNVFFGHRECRKQCLFIHLLIIILPKNQLFCVYLCHIADTLTHHFTSSMWLTLEFVRHQLAKFMICIILQDWRGNIKSLKLANLSRETNSINKIQKESFFIYFSLGEEVVWHLSKVTNTFCVSSVLIITAYCTDLPAMVHPTISNHLKCQDLVVVEGERFKVECINWQCQNVFFNM